MRPHRSFHLIKRWNSLILQIVINSNVHPPPGSSSIVVLFTNCNWDNSSVECAPSQSPAHWISHRPGIPPSDSSVVCVDKREWKCLFRKCNKIFSQYQHSADRPDWTATITALKIFIKHPNNYYNYLATAKNANSTFSPDFADVWKRLMVTF